MLIGQREKEMGKKRVYSHVCTSELLDAQELSLFGHSLGLENIKYHSNSVYNYRHIRKTSFYECPLFFFHSWQCSSIKSLWCSQFEEKCKNGHYPNTTVVKKELSDIVTTSLNTNSSNIPVAISPSIVALLWCWMMEQDAPQSCIHTNASSCSHNGCYGVILAMHYFFPVEMHYRHFFTEYTHFQYV